MIRIREVQTLGKLFVKLTFEDGLEKTVDLEPYFKGPVFDEIREPSRFRQVKVNEEFGCLEWPNGADLCNDVLYYDGPPPWAKQLLERRHVAES